MAWSPPSAGPTRRRSLLEMLLPTPDQIVRSYLTTDENLVLVDRPSTNAFIVEAARQLIIFGLAVFVLVAWVGAGGNTTIAAVGFVIVDLMSPPTHAPGRSSMFSPESLGETRHSSGWISGQW